ncbi:MULTISPECIES: DsbA family protein [unclassified Caulobacter]|jgi:protein-disulfide isomerase|uniref:DsbA family protein n=1 Tax=unclassified Caulobacter TaxID=2648921 RepID=UPI0006F56811|nr:MULTISPECIES: DsbA family protein [unclassified Caulobacter]KQV55262.1 disulfide bond formation protein DsbA [Caulobacter sp. Root342]KQV63549.1 disulfide bond formation protein DsbA [Caulobacter sp. Root343]
MRSLLTRVTLVIALAASLAACGPKGAKVTADDMTLGNPNAKVTVIEYASVACPHCARWNEDVFPAFKAKYIDTGKVHYVSREALTGEPRLANAGAMLARCAGKDKYFQVTDAIYHAQASIFQTGDIRGELLTIAQAAGMNEDQFNSCLSDENAAKSAERIDKLMKADKIEGTPTFIVNGKKVGSEEGGERTLAELDAAIAEASK